MVSKMTWHATVSMTILLGSAIHGYQPSILLSRIPSYAYNPLQSQTQSTHSTPEGTTTFLQASGTDSDNADENSSLCKQDDILQAALGITPETATERSERQDTIQHTLERNRVSKTNSIFVALVSFAAAILNYLFQYTHPVTDVQLLFSMSQASTPLTEIGSNGKPTVVDFWAPWCENCRRSASTLALIEKEYGKEVNFVMVNGDSADNWNLIEQFHVDAIPHMALVSREGDIETALIGAIPSSVLRADLDVLIHHADDATATIDGTASTTTTSANLREALPYKMFDPFQGQDENMRRVKF